jgi:hypothetical protein
VAATATAAAAASPAAARASVGNTRPPGRVRTSPATHTTSTASDTHGLTVTRPRQPQRGRIPHHGAVVAEDQGGPDEHLKAGDGQHITVWLQAAGRGRVARNCLEQRRRAKHNAAGNGDQSNVHRT